MDGIGKEHQSQLNIGRLEGMEMEFIKTIKYNNILQAFQDFEAPCTINNECNCSCPFYYIHIAFDTTCAGFCADYPYPASRLLNLEIKD